MIISGGTTTLSVAVNSTANGTLTIKAGATLALGTYTYGTTTPPTSLYLECGATGSAISGSGTITLVGNVNVAYVSTGSIAASISCPLNLGAATRTFTVANDGSTAADLTISNVISGSAGITKTGDGTMILSGTNTYIGPTIVDNGTLRLGAPTSALGTVSGGTTVNSGAVLDLNGYTLSTSEPLTLNGTGISGSGALINSSATAVTYDGAITLGSASSIGTTGNLTLGSNGITGSHNLTKVGTATLHLGTGTASLGSLEISAGNLTSTSGTMNLTGNFTNTAAGASFTPNGGIVNFNGASAQYIYATNETSFYNLTTSGTGTKTIAAGSAVTVNNNLTTGGLLAIESTSTSNSGSLIVNGTSAGNVTYNRVMPGSLYHYLSSPVSCTGNTLPATFYLWDEAITGDWATTTTYTPGKGYTTATASTGNTLSFTGSVLTSASIGGTAPYASGTNYAQNRTDWGGGGWNLLGNPFTSAMSATNFISVNGTGGNNSLDPNYNAVYIYNGTDHSYIGSQLTGWENIPSGNTFGYNNIQAGQGFFVLANGNGVSFSFTSAMQRHATSVPMTKSAKTDNAWPGLQLKLKYGEKETSTLIVYNDKMTAGLDPGYDIGLFSSGSDVEVYTTLAAKDNSVNFTRQALPLKDCDNNVIPVGIDSENGGEVTFSAFTIPLDNYTFFLEDRQAGIFTNLNTDKYTVTLPAKTYGTGRFFIIASANAPAAIKPTIEDHDGVGIWTSDDKVIIKGDVSEKARCEIYNVNGKKIVESRLNSGELNTIDMPSGSNGVYIVRVIDGVKVTTRKVAVF